MIRSLTVSRLRHNEQGIAAVLLLFAMSSFSVLGIAALTTDLTEAPSGATYGIVSAVREGILTKFVAPLLVPNAWRLQGGNGSYAFQLPVLVPENGSEALGSTGAWHAMSDAEVPGMSVCCEARAGVCSTRKSLSGEVPASEWTPGADDAQWLSLGLGSRPDSSGQSELVTATLLPAARDIAPDLTAVSCQLEFQGAVIARGFAHLRQAPRQDGLDLPTDVVEGMMDVAVRTR